MKSRDERLPRKIDRVMMIEKIDESWERGRGIERERERAVEVRNQTAWMEGTESAERGRESAHKGRERGRESAERERESAHRGGKNRER